MGGCRCTYRGCPNSSDSRTHFFHYPIRDKARCFKWMRNAGTLEFCNLKEPQLKNKVICEHHFTKECFMNAKCDSLVHDAVPTVDGPYVKSTEEDQSLQSLKDLEIVPVANTKSTDLETTDASGTTLTVSESPVLGLAFHSDDGDVKKPKFSQTYTEILTRRNTGMVEIWKRKMLESSQLPVNTKKMSTAPLRWSKRNVDKKKISAETELKVKAGSIYTHKSNFQQVIPKDETGKECLENVEHNTTELTNDILQKGLIISSSQTQLVQADSIVNMGNISSSLIQTQSDCEILPDVIVLPLDQSPQAMMNNHISMNEFKSPSTIILNNDGTITQNSAIIKGNQKITILETKTLPVSHMTLPNSAVEPDGSSSLSDNVMRMIERNSRDIIELKNLITQKQFEDGESHRKVNSSAMRKRKLLSQKDVYVRKLELFSNIVQYLSPKVARLVHKDMFNSNKMK